jgi:orotate phosphoribosyltransferase-like protein
MAADGMPESEIVEVTDLSRNTVTRAINRARVRELTDDVVEIDEATADIETVSEQLRQIARTLDPGSVTDDR